MLRSLALPGQGQGALGLGRSSGGSRNSASPAVMRSGGLGHSLLRAARDASLDRGSAGARRKRLGRRLELAEGPSLRGRGRRGHNERGQIAGFLLVLRERRGRR